MSGIIRIMGLGILSHQTARYQVTTPVYEGPLDLLLQLIEREELDITRLALAQVTDQYLAHLRELQEHAQEVNFGYSAEEVSAFLVIASRLVQIKSEALLPRPPARQPGEEDPGENLARQLMIYKQYRMIANFLAEREEAGLRSYLRLAPPPHAEGTVDLSGLTLADLVSAARSLYQREDTRPALGTVVALPKITIREKIRLIARQLHQKGRATFWVIIAGRRSRLDIVVTFLAMLELVKRHLVHARQQSLFSDIELEAANGWDEEDEFELEFGE